MTQIKINQEDNDLLKKLQEPFSCDEICFKVTSMTKDQTKGLIAAYVTNSAIQNRLDDVFGPFGWQVSFRDWKNGNAQLCCISVLHGDRWISKEDGAPDSTRESIKGGLSDSMKRCARMYGIGRYLCCDTLFKNSWVQLENKRITPAEENRLRAEYNQFLNGKKAASKPNSDTTKVATDSITKNNNYCTSNTNSVAGSIQPKEIQHVNHEETPKHLPKSLCDAVLNVIKLYNVNLDGILQHYNVKSVEMLSIEQAQETINNVIARNTNKN